MKTVVWLRILWVAAICLARSPMTASAQMPVVTVTNVVATVSEPNAFADFIIAKSFGPDVTVSFEMVGTAVLGTDYVIVGGTTSALALGSGNVATVRIQVLDDFLIEPDKTIVLHLLPGPGYTIGTPASATITLRSNDPVESLPPRFDLRPTLLATVNPPIVAPGSLLTLNFYPSGSYQSIGTSALVFLDSVPIGKPVYPNFRVSFTSPSPGLHLLTTVLTQTNGQSQIATQPFRVADTLLQPTSQGMISNGTLLKLDIPFQLLPQPGNDPEASGAFMEFRIPSAAANWKSALFMTVSGSGAHRLSTYRGNGIVTTNDAAADAELVAAFFSISRQWTASI